MSTEQTYIMIKPEGVERKLIGEIISRFERKGLSLIKSRVMQPSKALVEQHYIHLKDKPFFNDLVKTLSSGTVVCMVWVGYKAVDVCRKIIGATDPINADIGSIRADLAVNIDANVVHGSDSLENAGKEINLWFN